MTDETPADADDPTVGCPDLWERVGRKAAAQELEGARYDVKDSLHALTVETMFRGDDPSREQVVAARRALNDARRILEEFIAPAAGAESWGDPVPEVPMGVLWDMTDHPRAEDVDPREYLEEETEE